MVKVYARLCEKGEKNFNDVPSKISENVRNQINLDGYVINYDGTVTKK